MASDDLYRRRTLCPYGRPQLVAPWIERGWTDRDGTRWTSCCCGSAHRRPPIRTIAEELGVTEGDNA